jgi:polysaccharide biosynthesis/export protein
MLIVVVAALVLTGIRHFVDHRDVYYVAGAVANPGRHRITGTETVLDAINHAGGLRSPAAALSIRLVRPSSNGASSAEVLPVDYEAIVRLGATATNYQLMPGDRLIVSTNPRSSQ